MYDVFKRHGPTVTSRFLCDRKIEIRTNRVRRNTIEINYNHSTVQVRLYGYRLYYGKRLNYVYT